AERHPIVVVLLSTERDPLALQVLPILERPALQHLGASHNATRSAAALARGPVIGGHDHRFVGIDGGKELVAGTLGGSIQLALGHEGGHLAPASQLDEIDVQAMPLEVAAAKGG